MVLTITEVVSLNNINRLIFVAETLGVSSEVWIIFFILFRRNIVVINKQPVFTQWIIYYERITPQSVTWSARFVQKLKTLPVSRDGTQNILWVRNEYKALVDWGSCYVIVCFGSISVTNVSLEWISVRSHVKISAQRSAIPIAVFGSFPQSLQTNYRIVFQMTQPSFSGTFFHFLSKHPVILMYILSYW
jgi:hypothetical protein